MSHDFYMDADMYARPNRAAPGYAEYSNRVARHGDPIQGIPATRPPLLIGLTSPAMGAGKSVVAQRLITEHGFMLVKFAGTLKAMIRTLLNDIAIDDRSIERMIEGDLKEEPVDGLDVTPRRLMQSLGGEWGRDCVRKDLWVHIVRLKVQAWQLIGGGRDIVIDDMRYPNELDLIHELGGVPVRIVRPGIADATGHQSEGALNDIPMDVIYNSASIQSLHEATDGLVKIVRARALATASPL